MQKSGVQLMLEGLEVSLSKHGPEMARAEMVAELLAMGDTIITADDVRVKFEEIFLRPLEVGNALGALFKNKKNWEFFVRSKRPKSHARIIRTWRRRQQEKQKFTTTEPRVCFENGERFCSKCLEKTEQCTCQK